MPSRRSPGPYVIGSPVSRIIPDTQPYSSLVPEITGGLAIGTSNAYGSSLTYPWPSNSKREDMLIVGIKHALGNLVSSSGTYVQLGLMFGVDEKLVSEFKLGAWNRSATSATGIAGGYVHLPFPIFCPSGMQMSFKAAWSSASGGSWMGGLLLVPAAWYPPDTPVISPVRKLGAKGYRPSSSLAAGLSITYGSGGSYGTWTELTGMAPGYDAYITHLMNTCLGSEESGYNLWKIGLGSSSGTIRERMVCAASGTQFGGTNIAICTVANHLPIPLLVPSGGRVWIQGTAISANTVNVDANYVKADEVIPLSAA